MIDVKFFLLHGISTTALVIILLLQEMAVFDDETIFIILHALLGIYILFNAYDIHSQNNAGIFTFLMIFFLFQFGGQVWVGNFSYILGDEAHNSWYFMDKTLVLCFLSIMGLNFSAHIYSFQVWGQRLNRYFFPNLKADGIYLGRSVLLFIFGMGIALFMAANGLTGYGNPETMGGARGSLGGLSQYLGYLSGGANIVLYLMYYECLRRPNKVKRILFGAFLAIQVGLSLSSGMKKDTLAIFLCLFMIHYLVRRSINVLHIILLLIAVFGLYQFIGAYRAALLSESFNGDRIQALLTAIMDSTDRSGLYDEGMGAGTVLETFMERVSLVDAFSLIVEYKDMVGLGGEDPAFLNDLLLTPITVFVPRFLMPFKSMSTYGLWVSHTVMGLPETIMSSSYVTVEGFFYLAGGASMVLVGCFVLGAVLLFWSGFFRLEERNPLLIIVFFLIAMRVVEPSTPIDMVTSVTRAAIIFTFMGRFLVRWPNKRESQLQVGKSRDRL